MQTYSGRQFWPINPRPEEVELLDIAHALSMICRFNGHCRKFYSIAEHCVNVAHCCSPENRLWGLMHDAAEAYLCDLVSPIKNCFPDFKRHEMEILSVIGECFGFELPIPGEVKEIDCRILHNEKNALMVDSLPWILADPLENVDIIGYPPHIAENEFLTAYYEYRY